MYYVDSLNTLGGLRITPYVVLLALEFLVDVTDSASQAEINNHLELGKQFLSRGQLSDALSHYHAAVEGDPNNFLTLFKRGTVYLALGKARLALSDLDRTLQLQPDFTAARANRGSIHLKQGNLELAQIDFRNVLEIDPYNPEANEMFHRVEPARQTIEYAYSYYDQGEYRLAIQMLTSALETCPWSSKMRKLRAECYIEIQDYISAVADFRSATRLESDDTDGYLELSKLLYQLGHISDALKEIRECLKLDPEHPKCFPFYKKVKKVDKLLTDAENSLQSNDFKQCISLSEKAMKVDSEEESLIINAKQKMCTCLVKDEQAIQAIKICGEAIELERDPNTFCDRAEAYILSEMYEDAIRDYKMAIEIDDSFNRAKEGLQRAQKLQTQAERRDYYKILGVKRSATKKEIVKAYRKAAQKWHPDNFKGDEKKLAEKKFIDVAAAKEVLTDEEKRRQFDNGEDPLDPESQKNYRGDGFPFHHFQHGSPFQFKFHFN